MKQHEPIGAFLRTKREERGLSLTDLSRATKIKEGLLDSLEHDDLDALPARVFVIGFVRAYAREVGVPEREALSLLHKQMHAENAAQESTRMAEDAHRAEMMGGNESPDTLGRRKIGVALVVFLLLVVATLTLSLLLRHGGGDAGLS